MQLSVIMRSQANCVLISDIKVVSPGIRYLTLNISSTNYVYQLKNYDQALSFFRFSWSVGLNIHSVHLKPTEGIKALRALKAPSVILSTFHYAMIFSQGKIV